MFGQKSQTNMLVAGNTLAEQSRNSSRREKMHRWAVGPGLQYVLAATFALIHVVVFALGILNHYPNGKLAGSFSILGDACSIARAAALVLQLDAAILIFPVCRTLMSLLRRTFMSRFVRFDESISFHTQVAWFMVFFAWVHAISHWMAVAHLAAKKPHGLKGFLFISFATRPGWTGWIMLITLMIMAATSLKRLRQSNNKRFLNTHDLAILFFVCWSVHGALGIVKTDEAVSAGRLGPFVQYWVCGGFTYLLELVLRELRGRQRTLITKVIQHPNNVVEIQIKKENLKPRIGQVGGTFQCIEMLMLKAICSTFTFAAQKCQSRSTTCSHSLALLRKTIYLSMSTVLASSQSLWQDHLVAIFHRKQMSKLWSLQQ